MLPRLVGYVLLAELLEVRPGPFLRQLATDLSEGDLASDAAFACWVSGELRRDPALLTRARNVVAAFRRTFLAYAAGRAVGMTTRDT